MLRGPEETLAVTTAAVVTLFALTLLVALAIVAVLALPEGSADENAKSIATIVGATTTVIGTIVGAFVGNRVGAAGKEKAERERAEAQKHLEAELVRTTYLAANLPDEKATDTLAVIEAVLGRRGLVEDE